MTQEIPPVMLTQADIEAARARAAEVPNRRVTIVGQFHYQANQDQPETVAFAFDDANPRKGENEPFRRKLVVPGSVKLDFAWIADPEWLVITNLDDVKPLYFGLAEIPPKGIYMVKLRKGMDPLPLLEGDNVRAQIFATER